MNDALKQLLEKLGVTDDVLNKLEYQIEQDVARARTLVQEVPSSDASDEDIITFMLDHLRGSGKVMLKNARKSELELEMALLDKPEEVDLGSDQHRQAALHVELDQLVIERHKRIAGALLRFCDLVEANH